MLVSGREGILLLWDFSHVLPGTINVVTNFDGDDFKWHFPCLGKHMSLIMFDPMWTNELWAFKASRVSEDAVVDRESNIGIHLQDCLGWRNHDPRIFSGYSRWVVSRRTLQCSQWWQVAKARASRTCHARTIFENISSSNGILEASWNGLVYDGPYVSWTLILVAIDCFDNFFIYSIRSNLQGKDH